MSPRRRYRRPVPSRRAGTEMQQCNPHCGCSLGRCLSPFATNLNQRDMSGVIAGSQFGGGWGWPGSSVRRQTVNLGFVNPSASGRADSHYYARTHRRQDAGMAVQRFLRPCVANVVGTEFRLAHTQDLEPEPEQKLDLILPHGRVVAGTPI